jgi:hypothetical protein
VVEDIDDEEEETLVAPERLADLIAELRPNRRLLAILRARNFSLRLRAAIAAMPEALRGDAFPTDLVLCLGPHDLFDDDALESSGYIARASASCRLNGYGSASGGTESFGRALLALPPVQELEDSLRRSALDLQSIVMCHK